MNVIGYRPSVECQTTQQLLLSSCVRVRGTLIRHRELCDANPGWRLYSMACFRVNCLVCNFELFARTEHVVHTFPTVRCKHAHRTIWKPGFATSRPGDRGC